MPIFNVRAPDGSLMKISGPEDATDEELIQIAEQNYRPKKAPKERTYGEAFQDVGAKALSGIGGLAQLPGQLYGLATGSFEDTGLYGAGKKLEKYGESLVSPALKEKEAATQQKIAEAEKQGQFAAFKTGVAEVASDPAQLTAFLAQQLPQAIPSILAAMIPGVGPAAAAEVQAAQAAARAATGSAAKAAAAKALEEAVANAAKSSVERGASAAVRTAAVQQGADIGTGAYEGMYEAMIKGGASPEEAAGEVINKARLAGAGGAVLSLLAQRLPGAQAFERALAGERTGAGRLVGAGLGALKEIPSENVEEVGGRLVQNIAQRQIDPEQALTQGLGATAAQATIGAAGMGGLGGVMSGRAAPERAPAPSAEEELLALGMNKPFTPVSLPDGSVAMTQEDLDAYEKSQFERKYAAQPADKLALGLSEPFSPVALPDGSVALTQADLDAYEQEQFTKKYAAQPNLNTVTAAETPPQLGYSPLAGVPKIAPDGTVLLTPEQEFRARYAPQKTEEALGDESEIEAKFSRYNQGLKAAKDMLKDGRITPERFNVLQDQYNSFRAEYDAYKERTAAPLTPLQREAADIADKIETLGNKQFADSIRQTLQTNRFSQDSVQFYNEKLAEMQAKKAEEGQRIEEGYSFKNFLDTDKDKARYEASLNSKNADVSQTLKDADLNIQQLADTINRAGYTVHEAGRTGPVELKKLKDHISNLAGIANRLLMEDEASSKGYKRADPEKLQRALDETKADIAKAKQLIAAASVEKNELVQPPEVVQAEKDIAAAEMGVRKVKRESPSLWTALTGKLAAGEVRDIFSSKPTFGQRSLQTQNGAQVSDLVADGTLDEFLPPDMRHDSQTFDETASTEAIKEKLRSQNYVTFEAELEIKQLFNDVETAESLIREYLTAEEANKLILEAQNEQDEAGRTAEEIVTEGATGAPEAVSTQDLAARAKELGIDVDEVAQDVARRSEGLTQEQYNGELRKALEAAINTEGGQQMVEMQSAETKGEGFTATKEGMQMEKDLTGKSIFQAAQYLVDKAPNAFYKFVGKKILEKLNKMQSEGVRLNFTIDGGKERMNHMWRSNGKSQMLFSKDGQPLTFNVILNGEPSIKNQATHPSGMEYKTLMHELLHVATQAELHFLNRVNNNDPAVLELYKLGDIVAAEFKKQKAAGKLPQFLVDFDNQKNNALSSLDEMLTWSMTDERMQKWMSEIKVGEKTLMDKIVELIRKVMGIAKPYETALDRLVRTTNQIIDIDTKTTADGARMLGYSYGPAGGPKRMPREQQTLFSKAAQEMMESEAFLGKKEEAPTPTGAGVDSMKIMKDLGRADDNVDPSNLQKINSALKSARDNPKATAEAAVAATTSWLDKVETWAFSSDAALNNRIRRAIMDMAKDSKEKIGMLLNASLSQTVHSDAVASLFLQKGNIEYDKELNKWVGKDSEANFVKLSKQLDDLASKNNLTKQMAERIAHTAFEAKRLRSIVRFNKEMEAKIEAIKAEAASKRASSPVAASALSEKASRMQKELKYVSPEQVAMIEPGMQLFKIHPELNDVVDTWNKIRENTVEVLVESGLWSRNDAEEMLANADYVPFYREEQLEQNKGPKEFIRGLQVQAREPRFKGSNLKVNDIFDNQVRWVQYSINRAVRNRSATALADTAVEVGAAKVVSAQDKKGAPNVVRVWKNLPKLDKKGNVVKDEKGNPIIENQEVFYSMDDPMFVEAFTGLEAIVIPSWKWASNLANMLRQSVVMYPLFSVAQVPQDSFAAIFSSGLKPQYALRIPVLAVKEFVQTLRGKSKAHEELKNYGAVGVRDFTSAMVRMDAEIYAGLKAPPGVMGKVKHSLNHIAMSADNAVRQAVYDASMAQGLSKAEALEKAFDVFNVRRKGSSKSLALAGQLIPFFSAYLAAQNVAYKTITGRGISPTERQDAFKTLAATTASVMTLSLLYAMMNGDDEDYLKKPATVRDRLLMIPGTGGMSIPLRADLFTMPKIITEHMYLMMTDKGYEDGRKFRDSMKAALGSALLGPTAVPQAIKPAVEVAINYDFFQGRPLVGTYQQKLETERQFTDSTSELGKILGSAGILSPIAMDHLIRGMFGSAGGLIIYATNPILHSDPNTPRPSLSERDAIAALPGMSGFMMKSYESALKKDFYTLKEEVDKAANTLNDLKTRSPQQIEGFLADEENLARVGLQKSVNKIGERLSNIRKAITQITNSSMPADEKQQQIEMLRKAEEDMLKSVDVKMLRQLGKI